jgi:hypothetical protein
MRFVFESEVALPPGEVFERLRYYEIVYSRIHAAHEPPEPGHTPQLLTDGYRFETAERFGAERRTYETQVKVFSLDVPYLVLFSKTTTRMGPLTIRSFLSVDFVLEPTAAGTRLQVIQRISFGKVWLDKLLSPTWLWPKVAQHADEECRNALALLTGPEFDAIRVG